VWRLWKRTLAFTVYGSRSMSMVGLALALMMHRQFPRPRLPGAA